MYNLYKKSIDINSFNIYDILVFKEILVIVNIHIREYTSIIQKNIIVLDSLFVENQEINSRQN